VFAKIHHRRAIGLTAVWSLDIGRAEDGEQSLGGARYRGGYARGRPVGTFLAGGAIHGNWAFAAYAESGGILNPVRILVENTIAAIDLVYDDMIFRIAGVRCFRSEALHHRSIWRPAANEKTNGNWSSNTTLEEGADFARYDSLTPREREVLALVGERPAE
jgi:hypothetical protein